MNATENQSINSLTTLSNYAPLTLEEVFMLTSLFQVDQHSLEVSRIDSKEEWRKELMNDFENLKINLIPK